MSGGYYGTEAGYGGYEAGTAGGYSRYMPNAYQDASAYLYGPGSHASLSVVANGETYSSYAYETYRGGIFQSNTELSSSGVEQVVTYSYKTTGYSYEHESSAYTPSAPLPNEHGNGYTYGGSPSGYPDTVYEYTGANIVQQQENGYTYSYSSFLSEAAYADGGSVTRASTIERTDIDGQLVPGSDHESMVTAYNYGNGYTAYVQT